MEANGITNGTTREDEVRHPEKVITDRNDVTVAKIATEMKDKLRLTQEESHDLQNVNLAALNAKAKIFDLQGQLEQARGDLAEAIATYNGVLSQIASNHGVRGRPVQVAPGFQSLILIATPVKGA